MNDIDLQLLGRRINEMDAAIRTIRSENAMWQTAIRSEIISANANLVTAISDRIGQFETRIENRLDQTERSLDQRLTRIEGLLQKGA
jgi:hypothetical protein